MNPKSDDIWKLDKVWCPAELCYRTKNKPWKVNVWGFDPQGIGDLQTITFRMIIISKRQSLRDMLSFFFMKELLVQGLRWPNVYNNQYIAKNKLQFWYSKIMYNWGYRKTRLYRPQKSMTRDPWIYCYCCAIHLGMDLSSIPYPPWWLYDPKVWQWIRALKGKRNCYRFLQRISRKPKKDFVQILDQYMYKYYIIKPYKT